MLLLYTRRKLSLTLTVASLGPVWFYQRNHPHCNLAAVFCCTDIIFPYYSFGGSPGVKINLPVTLQPAVKLMSALQFSFRSSISLPLQRCSTAGAWLQSIVTPQWCAGGGRLPLCVEAKLRHGAARGLPAAAEERLSPGYTALFSTTVLYCDARCRVSSAARCRWSGASRWRERSAPPPRPPPPPAGPSHASCASWWCGRIVPPPRPRPARLPHCVARCPASSARSSPGRSVGQRPGLSRSV